MYTEAGESGMDRVESDAGPVYRFGKRAFDIAASFLGLLVLSPVFLVLAVIIFADDPHGSPFFAQTRVGKGGKEFRFYKFRTMVTDAEARLEELLELNEVDGPVFKIRDDPRITRVGKWLRRTCLDELPQLWNVLKGDMSLVGPRPAMPREVAQYTAYQRGRLAVRPGLTCYWQITPNRNAVSFDDWVESDLRYIREASFSTDLKILFRTVGVVFSFDSV